MSSRSSMNKKQDFKKGAMCVQKNSFNLAVGEFETKPFTPIPSEALAHHVESDHPCATNSRLLAAH